MALKSIVDIDIDDSKFQRFKELFDRYTETLKKQPEIWKKIGGIHQEHASQFAEMAETIGKISQLQQRGIEDTEAQETHLRTVDRLWTNIGHTAKDFAGNVTRVTTSLLKWTGILGAVGGLLGAGGLWGIDRMAARTAMDRRSAMGLGLSIGQMRAFDVNFGQAIDANSFLGWVGELQQTPNQRAAYTLLGRGLTGGSGDALALLDAIRGFAQRTPLNLLGPMASAYGIDLPATDLRRLRGMSDAEYNQHRAGFLRDQNTLGPPDNIAKRWTDFTIQMERATLAMNNTFSKVLAPLAGPLTRLSQSFLGLLDSLVKSGAAGEAINFLGKEVDKFAKYLTSDDVKNDIHSFVDGLREAGEYMHAIFHPVDTVRGWNEKYLTWENGLIGRVKDWFSPSHDSAMKDLPGYYSRLDEHFGLGPGTLELFKALEASGAGATSKKGAAGYFQLMPATAAQYGAKNPYDPVESANAAAKFISDLIRKFHGDFQSVVAGYNVGPAAVERLQQKYGRDWYSHLPMETQNFVGRGIVITMNNNTGGSASASVSGLGPQQ